MSFEVHQPRPGSTLLPPVDGSSMPGTGNTVFSSDGDWNAMFGVGDGVNDTTGEAYTFSGVPSGL
jgi:hypothetical protein